MVWTYIPGPNAGIAAQGDNHSRGAGRASDDERSNPSRRQITIAVPWLNRQAPIISSGWGHECRPATVTPNMDFAPELMHGPKDKERERRTETGAAALIAAAAAEAPRWPAKPSLSSAAAAAAKDKASQLIQDMYVNLGAGDGSDRRSKDVANREVASRQQAKPPHKASKHAAVVTEKTRATPWSPQRRVTTRMVPLQVNAQRRSASSQDAASTLQPRGAVGLALKHSTSYSPLSTAAGDHVSVKKKSKGKKKQGKQSGGKQQCSKRTVGIQVQAYEAEVMSRLGDVPVEFERHHDALRREPLPPLPPLPEPSELRQRSQVPAVDGAQQRQGQGFGSDEASGAQGAGQSWMARPGSGTNTSRSGTDNATASRRPGHAGDAGDARPPEQLHGVPDNLLASGRFDRPTAMAQQGSRQLPAVIVVPSSLAQAKASSAGAAGAGELGIHAPAGPTRQALLGAAASHPQESRKAAGRGVQGGVLVIEQQPPAARPTSHDLAHPAGTRATPLSLHDQPGFTDRGPATAVAPAFPPLPRFFRGLSINEPLLLGAETGWRSTNSQASGDDSDSYGVPPPLSPLAPSTASTNSIDELWELERLVEVQHQQLVSRGLVPPLARTAIPTDDLFATPDSGSSG